jgi:hypothetical protein
VSNRFEFPLAERIPGTFIYSLAKHILTGLSTGVCRLLRTRCRRNGEVNRRDNEQITYVWLLGTETVSFIFFRYSMSACSRPRPPRYRGFTITLRHATFGRIPPVEWTAQTKRPLPGSTLHPQQRDIHTFSGIRTHNSSKRAAADPCLGRAVTGWGVLRVLNE